MQLIISGRGVVLNTAFKDAVTRKVDKLRPLMSALVDARVTCTAQKFRRTVRVTLRTRRRVFSTAATAPDLTAAVDGAVEALGRQVREAKDRTRLGRRRAHPRRAAPPGGLAEPVA